MLQLCCSCTALSLVLLQSPALTQPQVLRSQAGWPQLEVLPGPIDCVYKRQIIIPANAMAPHVRTLGFECSVLPVQPVVFDLGKIPPS
jgi:hypothetical protein